MSRLIISDMFNCPYPLACQWISQDSFSSQSQIYFSSMVQCLMFLFHVFMALLLKVAALNMAYAYGVEWVNWQRPWADFNVQDLLDPSKAQSVMNKYQREGALWAHLYNRLARSLKQGFTGYHK